MRWWTRLLARRAAGVGVTGAAQCGLLGAALIQTLADLQQFKSLTGNAAHAPVESGLGASLAGIGKSRPRRAM